MSLEGSPMPGGFGEVGVRGREMMEEVLTLPQASATVVRGGMGGKGRQMR